jgi:hypothetical protein
LPFVQKSNFWGSTNVTKQSEKKTPFLHMPPV